MCGVGSKPALELSPLGCGGEESESNACIKVFLSSEVPANISPLHVNNYL